MYWTLFSLFILHYLSHTEANKAIATGFELLPGGTLIDDVNTDEISGITYNSVDGLYYAICDNLVDNKGFVVIDFEVNITINLELSAGYQMDRSAERNLTNMDSESIAFIENPTDPSDSYLIVGQEGYVEFNSDNALYLYSTDGTYIKTISDQLDIKFHINNTDDNRGLEALSVDEMQEYIVYSTEASLKSDQDFCTNCHRVSMNSFTVDTNDVKLTGEYELRYDSDIIDFTGSDDDSFNGLSDIAIFRGACGELYGLFLERAVFANGAFNTFDVRIYLSDLSGDIYQPDDVSDCYSLSEDNCKDIEAVDKTLLFSFFEDIEDSLIIFANFETLGIIYIEGEEDMLVYDEDYMINLVAITDNGSPIFDTSFIYLQYNASDLFQGIECDDDDDDTMTTTEIGDSAICIEVKVAVFMVFIMAFIWI